MRNIFKPRENFLVFTIKPAGAESILVSVDEDKKLHFSEPSKSFKTPKFLETFTKRKKTAIVSLHPSLGAVRIIPFKFIRATQSAPLEHTELENFLAQLAQKSFLELRTEVAEELGADELDTILVETRPFAYRSDGSAVGSPLGHKSREIHGFLEMLFTVRSAFDLMQPVLYSGDPVFMTVHDKSELMALKKLGHDKFVFLECSDDGGTRLLKYDLQNNKNEFLSRKSIGWSPARFFTRLEELWNVDRVMAEAIYEEYMRDNLSPRLRLQVEKLYKQEVAGLFTALKVAGAKGDIYIKAAFPLPMEFPAKQKGITIKEFPFNELFARLGFEFDEKLATFTSASAFAHLAPFVECYYDNSDPDINRSLRRRIHWLIA